MPGTYTIEWCCGFGSPTTPCCNATKFEFPKGGGGFGRFFLPEQRPVSSQTTSLRTSSLSLLNAVTRTLDSTSSTTKPAGRTPAASEMVTAQPRTDSQDASNTQTLAIALSVPIGLVSIAGLGAMVARERRRRMRIRSPTHNRTQQRGPPEHVEVLPCFSSPQEMSGIPTHPPELASNQLHEASEPR